MVSIIQVTAEAKIKVTLFGDSLMAGYGLTRNHHLDKVLQKKFDEQNIIFINASVSGDTSKGGLDRLDWSLDDKPNLIFLCLGANDMLRGINPDVTRDNLEMIIQKIKQKNIKIITSKLKKGSPSKRRPNTSKIKKLGYISKIPLDIGLDKTINWYNN